MIRVPIADFGVIQKNLAGAVVTVFLANPDGSNTGILAPIYQASVGAGLHTNPQMLNENGMLPVTCYIEAAVMCEISGLPGIAERQLKKIRMNPLDYSLPFTSANFEAANVQGATADAAASAAAALASQNAAATLAGTAATQAGIATTQAGNAATSAGTATTQAGIATTQAGLSAASATASANSAAQQNWTKVRLVSTANIASLSGTPSVDGVATVAGDRVAAIGQSAPATNGIYVVAAGAWARATDMDSWLEVPTKVVISEEGSANKGIPYECSNTRVGTLNTTGITWVPLPVADGAVSTASKIANNIITFIKLNTAAIASLGDWAAGTADKLLTAANFLPALLAAIGFKKVFTSSQQTITTAGSLTIAHGLPTTPILVYAQLVCTTSDSGYSPGDIMALNVGMSSLSGGNRGISIVPDATNLNIRFSSDGGAIGVINKGTGASTTITPANWKIVFMAWG